nr:MAG TPA: transcriptional regulator [Caudoviricetes sp.]
MMTRNGVIYDLTCSPYYIIIGNTSFYFSSKNHLEKFTEKLYEHRDSIKNSLSNRFGMTVELNILADIILYDKVETRGFFIIHEGVKIKCRKDIILSGTKVTKRNLQKP